MEHSNRRRILQVAHNMFNARGYRGVTIKELADQLGMSKKTIYQYYSGKEDIAAAVVEVCIKRLDEVAKIFDEPGIDPQFAIKEMLMHLKKESLRLSPLFIMDMEKYLPQLANRYNEFRNEKKQRVSELLKEAQHMDLIQDMPIPLVTEILAVCLKALVQSDSFSKLGFSTPYVLDVFLDIFGKGIEASSSENSSKKA